MRRSAPASLSSADWRVGSSISPTAQQRVGEISPQDGADLRHFACFAEAVEPRCERLLKRQRDRVRATFAALEQKAGHLLDEQRHPAGALAHALNHLRAQRMASGEFSNHLSDVGAIEGAERNHAVVRAQAPRRTELRPRGREDEERRLSAALGESLHEIEGGRIGPMEVLERNDGRLRSRAGENPCR
jgi:hypothetical protein